jgi:hypothetical protein
MSKRYCLDANFFIEAWNKYYSPNFCTDYWDVINLLGKEDRIFIPYEVSKEIIKTDDALSKWLKKSDVKILSVDEDVQKCLIEMYNFNPAHSKLVDNTKGRSLADPWVIAHAMKEKAVVVTKENKVTTSTDRIKIPNVCENMGIEWIDDFQFITETNIKFFCKIE